MDGRLEPPVVLYLAGANWDAVAGTDRRLVGALRAHATVIWVDPPISILRRGVNGGRSRGTRVSRPLDGVLRVRTGGPPALTRPIIRTLGRALAASQVRRALHEHDVAPDVVVVAFATGRFPRRVEGTRVLYVTDDWIGGAQLMGFSRADLTRTLRRNAAAADVVLAVSSPLAELIERVTGIVTGTLPNGAEPVADLVEPPAAGAPAILVGQLNERLDLDILERITASGMDVRVVGPHAARDHRIRTPTRGLALGARSRMARPSAVRGTRTAARDRIRRTDPLRRHRIQSLQLSAQNSRVPRKRTAGRQHRPPGDTLARCR